MLTAQSLQPQSQEHLTRTNNYDHTTNFIIFYVGWDVRLWLVYNKNNINYDFRINDITLITIFNLALQQNVKKNY